MSKTSVEIKRAPMGPKALMSTRSMVKIAVLAAVAVALQWLEIPMPFMPPWLTLDFSDLPAVIGAFSLGPVAGITIELLKNLLFMVTRGTQSVGVGELANFLIGVAMVLPAGLYYKYHRNRKGALVGLLLGIVGMAVMGVLLNYYVLLPFYAQVMAGGEEVILGLAQGANPMIHSMWGIVWIAVLPFNLLKGALLALVTLLVYKPLSPLLKR